MYDNLARRAILAALANDWETALEVNLNILAEEPDNTDALNRSARAYLQLGLIDKAVSLSRKVLTIDPLDTIAIRCIGKCDALQSNGIHSLETTSLSENLFLEIPGKTKIVSLVNLCESVVLARLNAGATVQMIPRMHKVAITTISEESYIGRLPDDLATRIIYLVKAGNEYDTYIKSVTENDVKVFIKEAKKAEAVNHIPSFPIKR